MNNISALSICDAQNWTEIRTISSDRHGSVAIARRTKSYAFDHIVVIIGCIDWNDCRNGSLITENNRIYPRITLCDSNRYRTRCVRAIQWLPCYSAAVEVGAKNTVSPEQQYDEKKHIADLISNVGNR